MQSIEELQRHYDDLTRNPKWRRFDLGRRIHETAHTTLSVTIMAIPLILAAFAWRHWHSLLCGLAGFFVGLGLSLLLNKIIPFKRWMDGVLERQEVEFRDIVRAQRALKRAKVGAINNAAIDIFRRETVMKRDFMSPRPHKIRAAEKLFSKAMWKAPDWPVPAYNIAICFYFENLLQTGIRNMTSAIGIANRTPDDPDGPFVVEKADIFCRRVVEASGKWFAGSVIDPADFIPYPADQGVSATAGCPVPSLVDEQEADSKDATPRPDKPDAMVVRSETAVPAVGAGAGAEFAQKAASVPTRIIPCDREKAKRLSDEGVSCAMSGNQEGARRKWIAATEADDTWSVPHFNLAKSFIDERLFEQAERYLNAAETRARAGSGLEDSQVVEQVGIIRTRISLQSELKRLGRI